MSITSRLLRLACRLPAPFHRAILRWGHRARSTFNRAFNVTMFGCTMIVRDCEDAVLLVKHSYADPDTWTLPGGSINAGESPTAAAERELREELGCSVEQARMFELEDAEYWQQRYVTCIISALARHQPTPDRREIVDARFFPLDDLPENLSWIACERIMRWEAQAIAPDSASSAAVTITSLVA